jgi:hypothetical protein
VAGVQVLVFLIAALLLLVYTIGFLVCIHRDPQAGLGGRRNSIIRMPEKATRTDKETIEKELTAQLLAGQLDRAVYRNMIEALAASNPTSTIA